MSLGNHMLNNNLEVNALEQNTASFDYWSFFHDQTIFLTGATGGLGGCLLHKLALELPTRKIFVLCRSELKAAEAWKESMPHQIEAIRSSGKMTLVVGDVTKINFGISADQLSEITAETTIAIHSAANTSFKMSLSTAVHQNLMPLLEFAKLASAFKSLRRFIQVSTAYCNSFREDGVIEEKVYPLGDPELELRDIMETGTSEYASRFPWAYAYSKHLGERLLLQRFPQLPILIVRPSSIGSAVHSPYPLYGPRKSLPIESLFTVFISNPGTGIFHPAKGHASGTNIFDEVPMDWVANIILLHTSAGTNGVIHAVAGSFVRQTLDNFLRIFLPPDMENIVQFVEDRSIEECFWANFYKVTTANWKFSSVKSEQFSHVKGPLSICMENLDVADLNRRRREKVHASVSTYKKKKSKL